MDAAGRHLVLKSHIAMLAGVLFIAAPAVLPPSPRLLWNATPSVPVGLYRIDPDRPVRLGTLVALRPPARLAALFAARGYLPVHVPLLKYIAAMPGQTVCRQDLRVTIDGQIVVSALRHDRRARPLPAWQGCRMLRAAEIFVLSPLARDSLDGRYFGVLPRSVVIGVATPMITRRGE